LFQPARPQAVTTRAKYGVMPTVSYRNAQVIENLLSNGRVGIDKLYQDLVMRRRSVNLSRYN
jgi:hypothetical protein